MEMFTRSGVQFEFEDGQFVARVGNQTIRAESEEELEAKVQSVKAKLKSEADKAEIAHYEARSKQVRRFEFFGPVYDSNDRLIVDVPADTPMQTTAASPAKATANLKHRIRKMYSLPSNCYLFMDEGTLTDTL